MARPKLGVSESRRLQMVITDDELEAIDIWQHENRVQSKSEAIRRLVQIGLEASRLRPFPSPIGEALMRDASDILKSMNEALANAAMVDMPITELRVGSLPLFKEAIDRAVPWFKAEVSSEQVAFRGVKVTEHQILPPNKLAVVRNHEVIDIITFA